MAIGKREIYVNKILKSIPENIKPVDYLMELLDISRESVYRRIRCQISFSFDEMVKLSTELGFSLDEIVSLEADNKAVFTHQEYFKYDLQNHLLSVLKECYDNLKDEVNAKDRNAILAMNNIWFLFTIGTDNLFRFFYYKWIHLICTSPLKDSLSNIVITPEIVELKQKIGEQLESLNHSVFIMDRYTYFRTMKDVQYYYRRKLITKEELLLIKKDLADIINYTEKQVINGTNELGCTHYFYISTTNIYSNSIYIEYDNNIQSFFYIFSMNPAMTDNPTICLLHKQWLKSLRKYSVLISFSNEELQCEFFGKQREYLEDLENDVTLTP